jgi:hypothetical protein
MQKVIVINQEVIDLMLFEKRKKPEGHLSLSQEHIFSRQYV